MKYSYIYEIIGTSMALLNRKKKYIYSDNSLHYKITLTVVAGKDYKTPLNVDKVSVLQIASGVLIFVKCTCVDKLSTYQQKLLCIY